MDFGKKGDAKKAMKLMWKEGITLKQAWKRVKGKESKKKSSKSLSPLIAALMKYQLSFSEF